MTFILRLHLRPLLCCKAAAGGSLLSMASSPENMEFVIDKKTIVTAITLVDRECVKSNSISLEINADDLSHKWNSPLSIKTSQKLLKNMMLDYTVELGNFKIVAR